MAATITFKTFCDLSFVPESKKAYWDHLDLGVHIWIDQKTVLVKQIWLKDNWARDRRKNEVWAWKPINMASKLASKSWDKTVFISDRFHRKLDGSDEATLSCWCKNWIPSWVKNSLWDKVDVTEYRIFDFDYGWKLNSHWCTNHWKEYCEKLLYLDSQI